MIWIIAAAILAVIMMVLLTPVRRQRRAVRRPDPEMNGHLGKKKD